VQLTEQVLGQMTSQSESAHETEPLSPTEIVQVLPFSQSVLQESPQVTSQTELSHSMSELSP
jgi:hypothetical protein